MPDSFLNLSAEERSQNSPENLYELQPEQLQGLPVIAPASTQGLYINYMDMVERLHLSPRRVIQTSNQVTALRMVAHGLGYLYSGGLLTPNASLSMFLTEQERQRRFSIARFPGFRIPANVTMLIIRKAPIFL